MASVSPEIQAFLEQAAAVAHQTAEPFSAHERFQQLLVQGMDSLRSGSYGIAASYVVRGQRLEIGLLGRNTLADGEPQGHAEMNALRLATQVLQAPLDARADVLRDLVSTGRAFVRACGDDNFTTQLFSTLEPCPMCTVNVINAGIDEVVFAHEDPIAGALAEERRQRLAPLWDRTARAQGLRVSQCQSVRPDDDSTYVPSQLLDILIQLFEVSREPLDEQLVERGFFHPRELLAVANSLAPARSVTNS